MSVTTEVLAAIAVLACAIGYGADAFAAIVLRSALSRMDDQTLTCAMGQIHRYADRRLPIPFVLGFAATALAGATAAFGGNTATALASSVAVATLIAWIVIYFRVSAPINRQLIAAVMSNQTLADARSLQQRWDRVVPIRVGLQTASLTALCVAIASGA